MSLPYEGFSLQWYGEAFSEPLLERSLREALALHGVVSREGVEAALSRSGAPR